MTDPDQAGPAATRSARRLAALVAACDRLLGGVPAESERTELLAAMRIVLGELEAEQTVVPRLERDAAARLHDLVPDVADDGSAPPWARILDEVKRDAGAAALTSRTAALLEIETAYHGALLERAGSATAAAGGESGEPELDRSALTDFLTTEVFPGLGAEVLGLEEVAGGYSKRTVRARLARENGVPASVVLRIDRPDRHEMLSTGGVATEFPTMVTLHEHGVRVPRPLALDAAGEVLGSQFLVMDDVPGSVVGSFFDFPPADADLGRRLAVELARVHSLPLSAFDLTVPDHDEAAGAVCAEIEEMAANWSALGWPSPVVEASFDALRAHGDAAAGMTQTLVHGDFGLHNILIEDGEIRGVLDWEFCAVGNPASDLGWFYDAAEHLMGWNRFEAEYVAAGGAKVSRRELDFFRLFGAMRLILMCGRAEAAFTSGAITAIQFAIPGISFYRMELLRAAAALRDLAGAGT